MKNKILFTGGGSAGHVTPNLALISFFKHEGWDVVYIGSKSGVERTLISQATVPYFAISVGKFRRYFSLQSFFDPFKVIIGVFQAFILCRKLKPEIVFSKGGFVAFPVVCAAWLNRIPVVVHESDLTIGLANKLCFPFATRICVTFAETAKHIHVKDKTKIVVTGLPIRSSFFAGNAQKGRDFCGFSTDKKVLLIFGGSLGAKRINEIVWQNLDHLLGQYQIVHICGEGKLQPDLNRIGYKQFAYLGAAFPDVLMAADLVVSRAGANAIYELIALHKPHILIPLSKAASRGDQIFNATYFLQKGLSQVLFEEDLTGEALREKLAWVDAHKQEVITRLADFPILQSTQAIYNIIKTIINKG